MALPMHGGAADGHGAGDDAIASLILDEIAGPRVFAVEDRAAAIIHAVLEIEETLAGFDYDDVETGFFLGELLRQQGRGHSTADDADVGLKSRHWRLL